MTEEEIPWSMTDWELIDELSALNGSERYQRLIEREALRRILKLLLSSEELDL